MKYFSVESEPISLPTAPEDDPVRILKVSWKGRAITGINQSAYRAYVWPVLTPAGVAVTEERPASDHAFHQSIAVGADYFFTYVATPAGRVEEPGMSFYTNSADMRGRGTGRIVTTTHNECTEVGETHLEIIIRLQWQGPEQGYSPRYRRVVAEEIRTISVFPGERANVIDVRSQLRPTEWDLRLGPMRHGYYTIRAADHLRGVDLRSGNRLTGKLIDSEGRTDDEVCWQHADWVDYYGQDARGRTAGLAVFQFPSFDNAAWYACTYGAIRVNPFRKAARYVNRGEEVDLAVRVVAHDGNPTEADIAGLYESFKQQTRSELT